MKLTNKIIDERLNETNIRRLDDYQKTETKISWKCLKCGYIWIATVHYILQYFHCLNCVKILKTHQKEIEIDNLIELRQIKRLSSFNKLHTKMHWQCLKNDCNYIWEAVPKTVIGKKKSGCPNCAGLAKLNNDYIDTKLISRNIKRLCNYLNNHTNIKWQCLNKDCNYIWETTSKSVINLERGCPKCNLPGMNEKLMHKLFKSVNFNYVFQYKIRNINIENPNYKIDAYFPFIKLAIEYNGSQHYSEREYGHFIKLSSKDEAKTAFKKQQARDQYIKNFCITNNIELIEIDGRKFYGSNLKKYLINELIPLISGKIDEQNKT